MVLAVILVTAGLATISQPTEFDWNIAPTEESRNSDAVADARENVDKLYSITGVRTQPYFDNFQFIYSAKRTEDLYVSKYIEHMCRIESNLVLNDKFVDYCQLDGSGECVLSEGSIVVYFYEFASLADWNCSSLNETVVAIKKEEMYSVMDTVAGQKSYGYWLSKDSVSNGFSTLTQSNWVLGGPLEGFDSIEEKEDDQVIHTRLLSLWLLYFLGA